MTVAELVAELSKHNPETPVVACIWQEFAGPPSFVDVASVERGLSATGPFVAVNVE